MDQRNAPSRGSGPRPSTDRVTVDFDVPARMRDGIVLRANVYRPDDRGPWPTLLARLPYSKDDATLLTRLDPVRATRRGFVVVVQDTRGRFASDGEWTPFRFEREDGFDSVEWAARLPGSNGRVGMYGESYFGNTQWMAALERPPSLAAIAPALTWSEPLDGVLGRGGALELGIAIPWTLGTGAAHIARLPLPDTERKRRFASLLDDYDCLPTDGYWDLPVGDMAILRRHNVPDLGTIHMLRDPRVPPWSRVAGQHQRVTVPTFNIGGWYDIFVQGTLDNYMAMAALGRPTRLLVGPWSHDGRYADPIGDVCFGVRSSFLGVPAHDGGDVTDLQLDWFDRHLASSTPQDVAPLEPAVRIFVMGRNQWRDEASWPLERARAEKWFLGADGSLNRSAGRAPGEPTQFLYDPADPVPTVGGHLEMGPAFPAGPRDQAQVEARKDVCVFTSEALHEDLEVTGRVRLFLDVASSSGSTDWVARLCDVHPDGRSFNLCDGIIRVTEGADVRHQVEIDLWSTSNVFLRGHRVRVQVTSSSFPRWDRNLNTGNQSQSSHKVARQHIFHDAPRPSYIELPVVR